MSDFLFFPAVFVYIFLPLVLLAGTGLQIRTFGRSRLLWSLVGLAVVWGIWNVARPFNIAWVPSVFIADFQRPYLVIRAAVVLLYAGLATASILRKSDSLRLGSACAAGLLVLDLLWAFALGRYVGP